MIAIDHEKCIMCGFCAKVCPALVIEKTGKRMEIAYAASCISCYHCVAICPEGAVTCDEFPLSEFKAIGAAKDASAAAVTNMLMKRRSVREFKDKPVPRELLEKLVTVASHAPTGRNAQAVELTIVTDRKLIDKLDNRILRMFDRLMGVAASSAGSAVIKTLGGKKKADALALYGADLKRYLKADAGGSLHIFRGAPALVAAHSSPLTATGKDDCLIALAHIMFAGEAHGLGATWLGLLVAASMLDPAIKKMLGIPMSHFLNAAMILGWPRYKYKRIVPRKSVSVKWIE